MVDGLSLTLIVGAVATLFFVFTNNTLVGYNIESLKTVKHNLNCTLDLSLLVGVLNSYKENAIGNLSSSVSNGTCEKVAEVKKACGARSKSCHSCTFLEISFREPCFYIGRGFGYIGKEKLGELFLCIQIYLSF